MSCQRKTQERNKYRHHRALFPINLISIYTSATARTAAKLVHTSKRLLHDTSGAFAASKSADPSARTSRLDFVNRGRATIYSDRVHAATFGVQKKTRDAART